MKKPDLTIPEHSSRLFTWHGLTGVAEISDMIASANSLSFGDQSTFCPIDGRVWSDAADSGFNIKSHRTGVVLLFLYVGDVYFPPGDKGGEFIGREYRSADGRFTVRVFND